MSILQNSNAISAGGYDINNSLRFRSSASAYLSRTPASAGSRTTWTWSAWVKRGALSANQSVLSAGTGSTNFDEISFLAADTLTFSVADSNVIRGQITTSAVFRDPSAWYHIVAVLDTTNATAANRMRLYINGTLQTVTINTQVAQNYASGNINNNVQQTIGTRRVTTLDYYLDGYQTEVNFIDGQALTPSSFGETDAVTGSWVAKKYTGTYGTNGFYLPFNSSNSSGFSSYYGNFNGSNQYLTFTGNTGLQFGTGDFTVEYWMYQTSVPSQVTILDLRGTPTTAPGTFGMTNTGIIYYNGTSNISTSGFTPTANTWVHVAFSRASGVMKIFANGVQYYSASETTNFNTGTSTVYVGRGSDTAGYYMPGYVSNLRVVKGTALYTANFTPPSSPLTAVSGTQLLMLQNATFVDNSSNAFAITNNNSTTSVSATIGTYSQINRDASGNNNSWAMNNINYTASGTTYDAMTDSPTNTSATVANYPTWNPLKVYSSSLTVTNSNLTATDATSAISTRIATMSLPTTGKWYWEVTATTISAALGFIGVIDSTTANGNTAIQNKGSYRSNGDINNLAGTAQTSGASYTSGDIIGVAVDVDAGTVKFYKNNAGQGGTPSFSFTAGTELFPYVATDNTAGTKTFDANFGQRPFSYTPPTGYKALNTYNLPDSTIKKGNKYMDATTYTGDGTSPKSQTNTASFKPDLVWIKNRSNAYSHNLYDSVRGTGSSKNLQSDTTSAEGADASLYGYLSAFNSNGFQTTAGSNGTYPNIWVNTSGQTYVAWQWQAGQGTTSSGTGTGGITSVTMSVNATAGFSIVTYTGSGANGTVTHGLGVAPKMVIIKNRSSGSLNWGVYNATVGNTKVLLFNTTAAASAADPSFWNNTSPTSTTFSLGTWPEVNNSGNSFVAYCWAEIAGFSKFGSYTGNGSADGPFVFTGFRPKFVMIKRTDTIADWIVYDTSRNTYNVINIALYANASNADVVSSLLNIDVLSNGFKLRDSFANTNGSGGTYIYAAFAENPFKNSLAR